MASDAEVDPEFQLFDARPTRLNIVSQQSEIIRPTYMAPRYPGQITFTVPSQPTFFTSSKILLKVVFKIVKVNKKDGLEADTGLYAKDEVAPINNFIFSAWSSIQCSLNGVTIENPSAMLSPYISYLKTLMSTSQAYKSGIAWKTNLFAMDDTATMDDIGESNKGWKKRADHCDGGAVITLVSELPLNLTSCYKALPPSVELGITLVHARDDFRLHGKCEADVKKYVVVFQSVELIVNRIALRNDIVESFKRNIQRAPCELHITRLAVSGPYEATKGETQIRRILTLGRVPQLCLVVMVDASSLTTLEKNPFNFQHFNISSCRIIFDGRPYPSTDEEAEVAIDVGNKAEMKCVHWWRRFNEACGVSANFVPGVSFEEFTTGCSIFAIPLVADKMSRSFATPSLMGRTEIYVNFHKPLADRIFLYVFGVFSETISLTQHGHVHLTYLPGNF